MGYRANLREFVITEVSFAGKLAIHRDYSFTPDYSYDEEFALAHFAKHQGREYYLGDWHSHPFTSLPYLSSKDKGVLKRIASNKDAGTSSPLSIVASVNNEKSQIRCWMGEIATYPFGFRRLEKSDCDLTVFD